MTEQQIRDALAREVSEYKTAQSAAADIGISPQYLNDLLKGSRPVAGCEKALAWLGLERVTTFRRKA